MQQLRQKTQSEMGSGGVSDYPQFEFKAETRWWMFWLARIFGRKIIGRDDCHEFVAYEWRGKLWLIK